MNTHFQLRAVQLHIDILVSSDSSTLTISEEMRTELMRNTQDLIADLFSRCIIDKPAFHDLLDQLAHAYVGGGQ